MGVLDRGVDAPLHPGLGGARADRPILVLDPPAPAARTRDTVLGLPTVLDALVAQLAAVTARLDFIPGRSALRL